MDKYRLVGKAGDWDIDTPASAPDYMTKMKFVEYVKNEDGNIIGANYMADYGHGYGFNNGVKPVTIMVGETFSFQHDYTSTTDGVWEDGEFEVSVQLIKGE